MLKAIFIYERRQSELLPRLLELLFNSDKRFTGNGAEILNLIDIEKPKLVFFDFEKPIQNEEEISSFMSKLNPGIQLHVSIIRISPSNFILYKISWQKINRFFNDHFGHHGKGSGIKEAFMKR